MHTIRTGYGNIRYIDVRAIKALDCSVFTTYFVLLNLCIIWNEHRKPGTAVGMTSAESNLRVHLICCYLPIVEEQTYSLSNVTVVDEILAHSLSKLEI